MPNPWTLISLLNTHSYSFAPSLLLSGAQAMVRAGVALHALHAGVGRGAAASLSPAAVVILAVAATVAVAAVAAFGCADGAKRQRRKNRNDVYYYGQGYPPPPPAGAYGYPAQPPRGVRVPGGERRRPGRSGSAQEPGSPSAPPRGSPPAPSSPRPLTPAEAGAAAAGAGRWLRRRLRRLTRDALLLICSCSYLVTIVVRQAVSFSNYLLLFVYSHDYL